jgi:site-specific DNA-cytosine methylase
MKHVAIMPLIGGLVLGAHRATGKKPEAIIDINLFNNEQHLKEYWPDVKNVTLNNEMGVETGSLEGLTNIDFCTTVPLCSGLSMLNSSNDKTSTRSRGSDAEQNRWIYDTARYSFENFSPKVLVGENAPNLFTRTGAGVRQKMYELGKEYGYSLSLYKTTTLLHGIPQRRDRTFYFFWKSSSAPILNWYEKKHPSLAEYLAEIPNDADLQNISFSPYRPSQVPHVQFAKMKLGDDWKQEIVKHKTVTAWIAKNNLFDEIISFIENIDIEKIDDEEIKKSIPRELKFFNHCKKKFGDGKGWWDASSIIMMEYTNAIISKNVFYLVHPTEDRYLTIREAMHLMGMPHDFKIDPKNWNQISQNVPVSTASDMIKEVMKFINGSLESSDHEFVMQNNISQTVETFYPTVKIKKLF